ncbi:hypothetical protein [Streptomyces sp. NPDC058045]|uniref:hypothetical protein n=1 Tax=Streptomyces sp. NPDC058045 TaxID=3346311 RepID=UPI0036E56FD4
MNIVAQATASPSTPTASAEVVLTESPTMRAATVDRTDVLDKVKAVALLPDGIHATTEIVTSYYEVGVDAIESVVRRNREELTENGMATLRGEALRDFHGTVSLTVPSRRSALRVFTRRAILNVGQLLTESDIARQVRTYLLDIEETATPEQRHDAVIGRAKQQAEVLTLLSGIVDPAWLDAKARHVAARALGEEPEIDLTRRPLTVGEYLEDKGVTGEALRSLSTTFGKRLKHAHRERYGAEPGSVERFVSGALRQVAVYTEEHRPLFDVVWAEVAR